MWFFRKISLLVLLTGLGACSSTGDRVAGPEKFDRQLVITISEYSVDITADPSDERVSAEQSTDPVEIRISRILSLHGLRKVAQWSVKALGIEAVLAEVRGKRSVQEVITALQEDLRVESVETVKTYKTLTYNDPYFELQSTTLSSEIEQVHRLFTGEGVRLAIVDTGMDRDHPELAGKIVYSHNFVAHDQQHFDGDEHGTAVAGVIAADANNALGIVGVSPDVDLLAFKACWQKEDSVQATCDSVSLVHALIAVLEQSPDIVNLSLAGPDDPLIRRLLTLASARGIVLVGAVDETGTSFPASMEQVIAVGVPGIATTDLPEHSVLAPGLDVLTTTPGSTYSFKSGSSISTAYVAGIAALLKQRDPGMESQDLLLTLRQSSRRTRTGNQFPMVDLCAAVTSGIEDQLCAGTAVVARED